MKLTSDPQRITISVAEAAKLAGCGSRTIRVGIANGSIPHLRLSRNILIPKKTFLQWIEDGGQSHGVQVRREQVSA